MAPTEDRIARP